MRLICPNCDAEYEVDASAIPAMGRDVQCSNCGHAWFQQPPSDPADDSDDFDQPRLTAETTPGSAKDVDVKGVVGDDDDDIAPPPLPADHPQRSIDTNLLAVLREEAEREAEARRKDAAQPIETQTAMALNASPTVDAEAERRAALQRRFDPGPPLQAEPARAPTRREMLPDIEEINSTLRPGDVHNDEDDDIDDDDMRPVRRKAARSGFRSGFVLMMIVAVLLALTYVMAPKISAQIPGTADVLTSYVATVDAARVWLDAAMKSATTLVRGLSGKEG